MMLISSHEAVMRQFRPALSAFDITEEQWHVLAALNSMPGVQIFDLAQATCLTPTKLSRIVKQLESQGLTERRRSGRDMRLKLIDMSPKGHLLIDSLRPIAERIAAEIAACCGSERLDELITLLAEMTARLSERGSIAFQGAPFSPGK
jgi:homoprotocatechuate degradation regulator HpaR